MCEQWNPYINKKKNILLVLLNLKLLFIHFRMF